MATYREYMDACEQLAQAATGLTAGKMADKMGWKRGKGERILEQLVRDNVAYKVYVKYRSNINKIVYHASDALWNDCAVMCRLMDEHEHQLLMWREAQESQGGL